MNTNRLLFSSKLSTFSLYWPHIDNWVQCDYLKPLKVIQSLQSHCALIGKHWSARFIGTFIWSRSLLFSLWWRREIPSSHLEQRKMKDKMIKRLSTVKLKTAFFQYFLVPYFLKGKNPFIYGIFAYILCWCQQFWGSYILLYFAILCNIPIVLLGKTILKRGNCSDLVLHFPELGSK